MKLHKGDTVFITTGKDQGKKGKIIQAFPKLGKVIVEGVNIIKKNIKPKKAGEKGQQVSIPSPLQTSKVKLICPKCGKGVRVGYILKDDKKYRICRKCKETV